MCTLKIYLETKNHVLLRLELRQKKSVNRCAFSIIQIKNNPEITSFLFLPRPLLKHALNWLPQIVDQIDVLFTDLENDAVAGWTIQVIYPDETNQDLEEEVPVEEATPTKQPDQSYAFRCSNCLKTYNAKRNLQRHMRTECGKEPQFGCTFCGYRNYRRNELVKHVKKRHRIEMFKSQDPD